MSTENLENENQTAADPEQEIVSQGVHNYSAAETYVRPTDPAILQQLEWFQDQKLALMMHFGLYCQPGMVASWALSDKDSDWSRHQVNWADGETFKKQYFNLNRSFNPVRFQPEEWAQMAARVYIQLQFLDKFRGFRSISSLHIQSDHCRSDSPILTADTYYRQPHSPRRWYQWQSCCHLQILVPHKHYPC